MTSHRTDRLVPRLAKIAVAAAALAALLAACGGGAGGTSATGLSAADAQATSANGLQGGDQSVSSIDSIYDSTQAIVSASAVVLASAARTNALAQAAGTDATAQATSATIPCAGGGTATLTISGGTLLTQLNGQFDAGEHYALTFAQCGGSLGLVHLDGQIALDILSVGTGTPAVTNSAMTLTGLKVTAGTATVTLDGAATLARSVATVGAVTTTTSEVTASALSMATAWNGRSGSFTLSNLDVTRTADDTGGVPTGSTISGHHDLNGTANGRTISASVSLTGSVSYDALGNPVSGAWTSVRPDATVNTTLANGVVTINVDDGSNGTIDHTWVITVPQLMGAAG
jgi:hypothetical protein